MILLITTFDLESLQTYVDKLNTLTEGEKLDIIVESDGGNILTQETLTYLFEELRTKHNITMIGNKLVSSGFELFKEFKGTKILHRNSYGMAHLGGWRGVMVREGGSVTDDYSKFVTRQQNELVPEDIKGFTAKQKKAYLAGEDVYLTSKELHKIMGL